MFSLQNKYACITGAGSGIGKAVAMVFAQQGAYVHILDVNEQQAQSVVKEIEGRGGKAQAHLLDVSNQTQVSALLQTIGRVDILVVEYSEKKQEVNDIVFNLPGNKGKGSFIWEPLSWGETVFDKEGTLNDLIKLYPLLHKKYGIK